MKNVFLIPAMNESVNKQSPIAYISSAKLLAITFFAAAIIQFIIIIYNQLTGFYVNESILHFFLRWIIGTVLTGIFFYIIIYPDLLIIHFLNNRFLWKKHAITRLLIESVLLVIVAVVVSVFATFTSHLIGPYKDGLVNNLINNALIGIVLNIIAVTALEGWIFFREGYQSKIKTEKLEKEIAQVRFEVLKNQINPHFLFNSLNVLSGLIDKNPQKAQQFIDEFSMIYRYVLETIDKKVIMLKQELEFAQSYMFLQKMRYSDNLDYKVNINAEVLMYYLPPLSLQTVLENAIKHNVINTEQPLQIVIFDEDETLVVKNTLKPKISGSPSTGIGQDNLKKRYLSLINQSPTFNIVNDAYVVHLPLIRSE